jgi:hypothetical protein
MRKRDLLFIPFILGIGVGLFSCNYEDKGNIETFESVLATVSNNANLGGTTIGTVLGYFAAPSLLNADPGDCVLLGFTIDHDNQPSDKYYTVTGIYVTETIPQSYIEQSQSVEVGDYTLPITSVSYVFNPFFEGKLFFGIVAKDKSPDFRLVYNAQEDSAGIKKLYLLAKPVSSHTSDYVLNQAFNSLSWIQYNSRDTTVTIPGAFEAAERKYIRVNLNYFIGMSEEGEPVFKPLNDPKNPIPIYIFK